MTELDQRAASIRRPRLKRTIEPIDAPDGTIHLIRAAGEDVELSDFTAEGRTLFEALDGTRSTEDLEEEFGSETVSHTLDQMTALSLLEDAAGEDAMTADVLQRYDRQLRYFSDVSVSEGPSFAQCQERLREARVAVLGAGGLGGRTAWELAALGVGEIRLTDGDRVEISNLNRQIQYREADVGELKAEVMGRRLREFNSQIRVEADCKRLESQEAIATFIDGATLVIGSADWPPFTIEHWINAACFEAGIPYISMNQLPPVVRIGPLYVPGLTGCFECQMTRYRRDYPLMDTAIEQRRGIEPQAATLSPTSGAIAAFVGMEVLHFLTGLVPPASLGVGLNWDFRTMTVERDPVIPEMGCAVCGGTQ